MYTTGTTLVQSPMGVGFVAIVFSLFMNGNAGVASASDGVVELNQACALSLGCSPADSPGFPITLAGGSYRLTGNLSVADPNTNAIEFLSSRVSLSLGGFTIEGPGSAGTGIGVFQAFNGFLSRVRDGTVRGFGGGGIHTGFYASVVGVRVLEVGGTGIKVGRGSMVRESDIRQAGALAVDINAPTVFADNAISDSGGVGLAGPGGSSAVVVGNTITGSSHEAVACSATYGLSDNLFSNNNGGSANDQTSGLCRETGPNLCGASTTCP